MFFFFYFFGEFLENLLTCFVFLEKRNSFLKENFLMIDKFSFDRNVGVLKYLAWFRLSSFFLSFAYHSYDLALFYGLKTCQEITFSTELCVGIMPTRCLFLSGLYHYGELNLKYIIRHKAKPLLIYFISINRRQNWRCLLTYNSWHFISYICSMICTDIFHFFGKFLENPLNALHFRSKEIHSIFW